MRWLHRRESARGAPPRGEHVRPVGGRLGRLPTPITAQAGSSPL
ncbi:hypothetical protein [Nonomuraea rubra]